MAICAEKGEKIYISLISIELIDYICTYGAIAAASDHSASNGLRCAFVICKTFIDYLTNA